MAKYRIKSDLKNIIKRYLKGKASSKEEAFLGKYYDLFDREEDVLDDMAETKQQALKDEIKEGIWAHVRKEHRSVKVIRMAKYPYHVAAVAVLAFLLIGTYFIYTFRDHGGVNEPEKSFVQSVHPESGPSVILTLANGDTLMVDHIDQGEVVQQDGMSIEKSENGTLIYTIAAGTDDRTTQENVFNTIHTPKGKQFQLNLSDGTKVWLNAETSLTYPVHSTSHNTLVELDGEAYFEVSKQRGRQFVVKAKQTETKVLGTKFNVNAYRDAPAVTTSLLEGQVSLMSGSVSRLLSPGKQGIVQDGRLAIEIVDMDIEEVMAWRNGYFMFNNIDVKTMMNMIRRWYDIEVVYEGNVEHTKFIGTVGRFENIEQLLSAIEMTGGVRFRIENKVDNLKRKVVVMP